MGDHPHHIEYAIRYCMGRSSYAFDDGLELAENHWRDLSAATREDVLGALVARSIRLSERHYPNLAKAMRMRGQG